MKEIEKAELLKNPDVIREIHQHLWLESEKAGYNIGLTWAAEDWMNRYAQGWVDYHMPGRTISSPTATAQAAPAKVRGYSPRHDIVDGTPDRIKKRRAKSYFRP